MTNHRYILAVLAFWLWAGCSNSESPTPPAPYNDTSSSYGDYGYGTQEITFLAEAPANSAIDVGLSDLEFSMVDGATKKVRDLSAANGAVVVVTRGNTNPICPYCSTQTANYIRDYQEFRRRNIEVLLVYPIETRADTDRLSAFLDDARTRIDDPRQPVPFPVLFDVELTAVDHLGIRKDLSKPATYLVDSAGQVTYAYVGSHWGDRPAVAAILKELDQRGFPGEAGPVESPPAVSPKVDPAGTSRPDGV